ncbi:MAG: tRNA preQ1(34) S-adenosylmethionine ribosyltransferase-isomerase QueA [Bradymonadia bacterium]
MTWRDDYRFELPPHLVAQTPPPVRGESRLLHLHPDGTLEDGAFARIVDAFRGDELLVVNDTRVVPARVLGHKSTGGAAEVFVVAPVGPLGPDPEVVAVVGAKRPRAGTRIVLPEAEAELLAPLEGTTWRVRLLGVDHLWSWLERVGRMPLPPYVHRPADADDSTRYQTVFAREPGAVAAPTAGLHFTTTLLDALRQRGVEVHTVTLHVGLGTFTPIRSETLDAHIMHAETFEVPHSTRHALTLGRPVVAVGTTVVRALETYAREPEAHQTRLFIRPGFQFQIIDGLVTNFHLPESTLLMLVSALAGRERVLDAYRRAVELQYRFFSYGDAMLLHRTGGRWT